MTPKCQYCDIEGDGVQYPIFPMSDAKFGEICAECDDERVAELAELAERVGFYDYSDRDRADDRIAENKEEGRPLWH